MSKNNFYMYELTCFRCNHKQIKHIKRIEDHKFQCEECLATRKVVQSGKIKVKFRQLGEKDPGVRMI